MDLSFHRNTNIDCGENIKIEDISEEINEEGSDEPRSILSGTVSVFKESLIINTCHRQHSLFPDKSMLDIHKFIHIGEKQKVLEEVAMSNIKEEEVHNDYVDDHVDCGENINLETIKEEMNEKSVVDPSPIDYYTIGNIKEEIKEEVDEEQGFDDSNLDTDNLVDCSEFVQVQMNLTK